MEIEEDLNETLLDSFLKDEKYSKLLNTISDSSELNENHILSKFNFINRSTKLLTFCLRIHYIRCLI